MGIGSTITGVGATAVAVASLYDRKQKKLKTDNLKSTIYAGVSVTGTAMAGATLNHETREQIHEKYSSAYVESMSDEELEQALVQMDLLMAEQPENTDVKTV